MSIIRDTQDTRDKIHADINEIVVNIVGKDWPDPSYLTVAEAILRYARESTDVADLMLQEELESMYSEGYSDGYTIGYNDGASETYHPPYKRTVDV